MHGFWRGGYDYAKDHIPYWPILFIIILFLTVHGYANSWYIDPAELDKDGDGNFTMTLYFKPQSYFYLGLAISLTTFILCILYLIFNGTKPYRDGMGGFKSNLSKMGLVIYGKNRRRKEEPAIKTEQKPLEMPKIVTKTVGAINDRSRLIIKQRSNPELKALRNHIVHKEYHYKQKQTLSGYIKRKMDELKGMLKSKKGKV